MGRGVDLVILLSHRQSSQLISIHEGVSLPSIPTKGGGGTPGSPVVANCYRVPPRTRGEYVIFDLIILFNIPEYFLYSQLEYRQFYRSGYLLFCLTFPFMYVVEWIQRAFYRHFSGGPVSFKKRGRRRRGAAYSPPAASPSSLRHLLFG